MHVHDARLRVRYAETDQMGVVYHSNHLIWMEVGRIELCKSVGVNYRDLEREEGIHLAVVEARCRYLAPALYDDDIVVRTRIVEANRRMLVFGYEILHADGRKLATGETRHVYVDRDLRPATLPQKYLAIFGAHVTG